MKTLLIFLFSLIINLIVYIIKLIAAICSFATLIILSIGAIFATILGLVYEHCGYTAESKSHGDGIAELLVDMMCIPFEKRFWIWHKYTIHIKKE